MAFRKKAKHILAKKPDILIVQECEHPDILKANDSLPEISDKIWIGDNQHKGLAVFTFGGLRITELDHNPLPRYVLPVIVYGDNYEMTLLAVWAQKPERHDCYTEQVWNAIHIYKDLLHKSNLIIAGDFNSNSIWDKPKRIYNHSNLVSSLASHDIHSAYHQFHQQEQGKEQESTLFMHRKIDRPYHIDYFFTSRDLTDTTSNVEIGRYNDWIHLSDHMPLTIDIVPENKVL